MEVQSDLIKNPQEKSRYRSHRNSGPCHYQSRHLRAGAATAACPQSKSTGTTRHDGTDPPHWLGDLCNMLRRHDVAHRHLEKWASVSILHLLELRDQGEDGL